MKKIIFVLLLLLAIAPVAGAQTIDNIDFSSKSGGFTVTGKASGESISIEVLKKFSEGNEETRLEYAAVSNAQDGKYSHNVKIKNPNGIYVLKVSDGTEKPSQKVMYLSDNLSSDGITTDMPENVSIGERIDAEVNIRNYTYSDITLYYTAAFYDNNGKLLGVNLSTLLAGRGKKNTDFSFEVPAIPEISKVSVIVMDDDMHPLGVAKNAEISEHTDIYVKNGSEGDGSAENPFGDIDSALNLAAKYDTDTVIYLHEGIYNTPLNINNMKNITLAACHGENVRFTNSISLKNSAFTSVTDSTVYNRLPADIRDNVKELDLTVQGINGAGVIPKIAFDGIESPYDVLTINGKRSEIARWPNEGYTQVYSKVSADDESMVFKYIYNRAENWLNADGMWVAGFWSNGWSVYSMPATVERIEEAIPNKIDHHYKITTDGSAGNITGGLPGGRFYVFNIPEELDSPGEWFINTDTNKLYLLPSDDFENSQIQFAVSEQDMITVNNSSNIKIMGINFETVKGHAIYASSCDGLVVFNCMFKNIAEDCIWVSGTNSIVSSCKIESVGSGGIYMEGGNRSTLTSGNNIVENNEISDYAKDYRVYNPAVAAVGVGVTVAHNKIYNAPHTAIQFTGNEHIIEYNDIRNVVRESGDAGAIYCGRKLLGNGNIIRYNYFENLKRVSFTDDYGVSISYSGVADVVAIYLDDLFSGATVHGNIMNNVDVGILMGGGSNNIISNNIIMNKTHSDSCSIIADARGTDGRDISGIVETTYSIPYKTGIWVYKYPENLISMLDENIGVPINNKIINNAFYNHNKTNIHEYAVNNGTVSVNPILGEEPGFVNYSQGDFRLTDNAYIYSAIPDFTYIPFEKIGLR